MEDDLIEYFLKWELEWLLPAGYEDDIKRVKEKTKWAKKKKLH